MSSEYEQLKGRLDESIRKDEAKQKILRAKREEKRAVKKAGGGKNIAERVYGASDSGDTEFTFGHNNSERNSSQNSQSTPGFETDIDRRIAEDAASRCMGRVACQVCKKFHGYCVEIDEEKERYKMLPTGNESPSSGGGKKREGAMKWVKVEDLSITPKEAKILMVRLNKQGRFGARVEMKLALDGQIMYFGVPPNKEQTNYALLIEKFGPEENDWVDQRILLYLEKDKFSEQYFIRVDFPKKATRG